VSEGGKTATLYKDGDPKLIETASVVALKVYSENPTTNSASKKFEITDVSVVFRSIDKLT
jgi:dihydroorotase